MENLKQNDKLLWETRFFALSQVSGEIVGYRGIFIQANTLPDAMKAIRNMNAPYLFLTGVWFKDFESVIMNDNFHDPIDKGTLDIESMSFDEFCDWLDNSLTVGDLIKAKKIVKDTVKTPEEHFKIIDTYIKRRNNEETNQEENDEEESS